MLGLTYRDILNLLITALQQPFFLVRDTVIYWHVEALLPLLEVLLLALILYQARKDKRTRPSYPSQARAWLPALTAAIPLLLFMQTMHLSTLRRAGAWIDTVNPEPTFLTKHPHSLFDGLRGPESFSPYLLALLLCNILIVGAVLLPNGRSFSTTLRRWLAAVFLTLLPMSAFFFLLGLVSQWIPRTLSSFHPRPIMSCFGLLHFLEPEEFWLATSFTTIVFLLFISLALALTYWRPHCPPLIQLWGAPSILCSTALFAVLLPTGSDLHRLSTVYQTHGHHNEFLLRFWAFDAYQQQPTWNTLPKSMSPIVDRYEYTDRFRPKYSPRDFMGRPRPPLPLILQLSNQRFKIFFPTLDGQHRSAAYHYAENDRPAGSSLSGWLTLNKTEPNDPNAINLLIMDAHHNTPTKTLVEAINAAWMAGLTRINFRGIEMFSSGLSAVPPLYRGEDLMISTQLLSPFDPDYQKAFALPTAAQSYSQWLQSLIDQHDEGPIFLQGSREQPPWSQVHDWEQTTSPKWQRSPKARSSEVEEVDLSTTTRRSAIKDSLTLASTTAVATNPKGTLLLAGNEMGAATLWDLNSSTPIKYLPELGTRVNTAAIGDKGKAMALATQNRVIHVWPQGDHSQPWSRKLVEGEEITALAIDQPGNRLAACTSMGTVHLLNLKTGEPLTFFRASKGHRQAGFSPNGRYLAACGHLWDLKPEDGEITSIQEKEGTYSPFKAPKNGLLFSPDGLLLERPAWGDKRFDGTQWHRVTPPENKDKPRERKRIYGYDTPSLYTLYTPLGPLTFDINQYAKDVSLKQSNTSLTVDVTVEDGGCLRTWVHRGSTPLALLCSFPEGVWASLSATTGALVSDSTGGR